MIRVCLARRKWRSIPSTNSPFTSFLKACRHSSVCRHVNRRHFGLVRWEPCRCFFAGGLSDILARLIAQALSERLGQQVVVDDRPGAGSNLATEIVARAPPDGY